MEKAEEGAKGGGLTKILLPSEPAWEKRKVGLCQIGLGVVLCG